MENGVRTLDVDTHTSSRHSVVRTLKGTLDPTAVFEHHPSSDPDALCVNSDMEFL